MLVNKNIIIIGANGLIGYEILKSALLANGSIIAIDKNINSINSKLNNDKILYNKNNLKIIKCNISDTKSIKKIILGSPNLSGLINCAYLKNKNFGKRFEEVSLKSFNENIALNLGSSFIINKFCVERFKRHKKSFSLVNLGSIYGDMTPRFEIYKKTNMTTPIEYIAIKSSIIHLTKYVSAYVKNSNFRCNCISPGGIEDNQPKVFQKKYKQHSLGKGMLKPNDISNLAIFLLSDKSKNINGQNIIIDDGFSL